ncbi:lactate utilization protein [Paralimibaculum aggregatum]|uniref:Lactate utilization protein n=1 Tax=Paralimibaculum aggregatum TaxID=3036245 RepID=A0ABQ6LFY3_9RHOB|nr:LUD domain-containing protein [Limibaculum sp. NKW23]GMG82231.1 lactate utilization protein [Limibaculum sp. NKW23]
MSARDRILGRVRRATGGRAEPEAARARLAAAAQPAPIPAQGSTAGAAMTALFIEKARAADATLSRIDGPEALPQALAEELRARNLPAAVRIGEEPLFERDWGGIEASRGTGRLAEPATLSRAVLASAETGTLLLASGPDNPVTLTFLGETHFAVLSERDICAGFEALWARWRELGRDPRTVNLVTGPSRSADIGQTLQLGAHGPVALHIFLMP